MCLLPYVRKRHRQTADDSQGRRASVTSNLQLIHGRGQRCHFDTAGFLRVTGGCFSRVGEDTQQCCWSPLVAVGRRWSCFGPAPTSPNNGQKSLLLLQRAVEAIVPFSRPPQTLAARDRPTAGNTETVPHNLPRVDEQPVRPVSSVGYPWRGDCPDPAQTRWFGLRTDDEWAINLPTGWMPLGSEDSQQAPCARALDFGKEYVPWGPQRFGPVRFSGTSTRVPRAIPVTAVPSNPPSTLPTPLPSHHQGPCPS